jgi:phosphonate transport system permease protein
VTLLRWDINVRESAVLGLVGAGGIGMALDTALNLFQWPRVAVILASIFGVVLVAEVVVTQLRKRILVAEPRVRRRETVIPSPLEGESAG